MTRGQWEPVGATRVSQNGYHYTKTEKGWELTHRLMWEKCNCRTLYPMERVYFIDGDRTNLEVDNIGVRVVNPDKAKERKRTSLQARIEELQAQLEDLDEQ